MRPLLGVLVVMLTGASLVLVVAAIRLGSGSPSPPSWATATARIETRVVAHREVVTATPTRTAIPTPTPKPVGPCWWGGAEGEVCTWPTPTQALPLPECGTPLAGQTCVWRYRTLNP